MMCLQQITQYMYLKLISSHAWTFKLFYLQVHYIYVSADLFSIGRYIVLE